VAGPQGPDRWRPYALWVQAIAEFATSSRKNFTGDTSQLSLFPARLKNYRREMRVCCLSCHN